VGNQPPESKNNIRKKISMKNSQYQKEQNKLQKENIVKKQLVQSKSQNQLTKGKE
jgi:hypothetical protein